MPCKDFSASDRRSIIDYRVISGLARLWIVIALSVISYSGCETNPAGLINPRNSPPDLRSVAVSFDSVNVDEIISVNGRYTITLKVTARVSDDDGSSDIRSVSIEIFRPGASSSLTQVTLRDDGIAPDDVAGDSTFSADVSFQSSRAQTGRYKLRFLARDRAGARSSVIERALFLTRRNSPPRLLSETLIAPDTLVRPNSGFSLFFVSIAAADSDGLADIREVFLRNLNTGNRSFLQDDGGISQPGGITSGDLVAGDGVFSITLQLPSTLPPGVYPFNLQATDTFGDTSGVVPYTLVVQ